MRYTWADEGYKRIPITTIAQAKSSYASLIRWANATKKELDRLVAEKKIRLAS